MRAGLRFDRRDAAILHELADRAKRNEIGEHAHSVFALAADAASTGEPLIVECETKLELVLMAQGYSFYGVRQPVIDELSGQGGTPGRSS